MPTWAFSFDLVPDPPANGRRPEPGTTQSLDTYGVGVEGWVTTGFAKKANKHTHYSGSDVASSRSFCQALSASRHREQQRTFNILGFVGLTRHPPRTNENALGKRRRLASW